jgi:hypothetical protein
MTSDSGRNVKATRTCDAGSVDIDDHEQPRIPDAIVSGG